MNPYIAYILMFLIVYLFNEQAKMLLAGIDEPKHVPKEPEEPKTELLHNPDGTMNENYNRYKASVLLAVQDRKEKLKAIKPISDIETIDFEILE